MSITIPPELNCRGSDKKPLDLLREARTSIDTLSDRFGFLSSNAEVKTIYAQLDGAIAKLEDLEPLAQDPVLDTDDSGAPIDAQGAMKLIWGLLTDK